jgi:hypothetical protein
LKHNKENCRKLAQEVVEGWEMDTLLNFAVDTLEASYIHNSDCFHDDVESIGLEDGE